jgi:hypothetical protein
MTCALLCSAAAELVDLVPHMTDDLLNAVDQPLQVAKDAKGNAYLLCDYNRDGDSYRCASDGRIVPGAARPVGHGAALTDSSMDRSQVAMDQHVRPSARGRRAAVPKAQNNGDLCQ